MSCGQDYNSNSGDAALGGSGIDCTTPAGARLCAAYDAFKHNGCFAANCHSSWSEFKTDAAWLGSGLVSAGSASGSTLFQKLQLPGGGGGNMPKDRGPMSAAEYQAVQDWITAL